MRRREPYRRWPAYLRAVAIWFLITGGISIATVLGIFRGIFFVMDYFLEYDRFYEGVAASAGVSAIGTIVLFIVIFAFIRRLGRYPRRGLKGMRGI